jgi:hypothetical protein
MRTKTMLLSALLGTLGSVSLMAQSTNVYSLNAVGYINVTIEPGYNIISCPLIASPDNTINTLLTNGTGQFKGFKFYPWNSAAGAYGASDTATATKWAGGGTETLLPGQAGFIYNPGAATTVTFVGTVPSGSLTNALYPGYNLISSILPTSGLLTNGLMDFNGQVTGDKAYTFNAGAQGYDPSYSVKPNGQWVAAPNVTNVGSGLFYYNSQTKVTNDWVENFSVGQ